MVTKGDSIVPEGIRATVRFGTPSGCPIAGLSAASETVVDTVASSVTVPGEVGSATEFLVEAPHAPYEGAEPIFSYGSKNLFRLDHDGEVSCPCECLGVYGCAIERYVAESGDLTIAFHAADFDELQAVIADCRERFDEVDVRRLVRSPADDTRSDAVFVDRSRLTTRQLQVLQTAYRLGYFERPRRANATEVAAELGIDASTMTEHLTLALSKVLDDLLEDAR